MAITTILEGRGEPRVFGEKTRGGRVVAPRRRNEVRRPFKDQRGQAAIEYILLLSMIVAIFVKVSTWANQFGLAQKMVKPISKDFAAVYQFGDPRAAGFETDSPKRHPRILDCEDCFRLFINPSKKGAEGGDQL